MNQRWQQVAELYGAVLDRPPGERVAILDEACRDDAALRDEVEFLLTHEHTPLLIDRPIGEIAHTVLDVSTRLQKGQWVGRYQVDTLIGEGGMGQVYRAFEPSLRRGVALKILPPTITSDPDRVARFEREAHVLASLNHPNVAAVYAFEHVGDVYAIALELVEGTTLAERIAAGPVPLGDALPIARQIAEALLAAHELGIVHRDLKPANVKVRQDGTVKVLDFGLAKVNEAVVVAAGDRVRTGPPAVGERAEATVSLTSPVTALGMILGTAAYMSPEQARGHAADKRSDVWAFGCVLYEMLSGGQAFQGADFADVLATVLRGEVDWDRLPTTTPPIVRTLLQGCLEKDVRKRVSDVSVALFALNDIVIGATRTQILTAVPERRWHVRSVSVLAVAIGVALSIWWAAVRRPPGPAGPVVRSDVTLSPGHAFTATGRHVVAISPDAHWLAFTANNQLYVRQLDRRDATPVPGSGGALFAREPFFSPDSQWIGFWHDGALKKVAVSGGAPMELSKASMPWGINWTTDDTIVFGQGPDGVWSVPSGGGVATQIVPLKKGQQAHGPQLLPGGRAVLFTLLEPDKPGWEDADIVVQDLQTGQRQVVVRGAIDARYLETGHLIYAAGTSLFAVPFDVKTTRVGGPVAHIDDVARAAARQTGSAHFTVSRTGTLVYVAGSFTPVPNTTMVWLTREGREEPLAAPARPYLYPRVSPDGLRVAVAVGDPAEAVWVWDTQKKTLTRVTASGPRSNFPLWAGNDELVYTSTRGSYSDLWRQTADGSQTAQQLTTTREAELPTSVLPDGSALVFQDPNVGDVHLLPLQPSGAPHRLLWGPATFRNAEVSHTGRWLAYESNESGRFEIYVRPFPDINTFKWPVSTDGGTQPAWGAHDSELLYVRPDGGLNHVVLGANPTWQASAPRVAASGPYQWSAANISGRLYDVAPDGRRLLVLKPSSATEQGRVPTSFVMVQNWFAEFTDKGSRSRFP